MTDKKTALVLGATGLVGKSLLNQLLRDTRYAQITALVRRPLPQGQISDEHQKLQPVVVDFETMDQYQGYFGVDHVYVCLGTTIKQAGSKQAFRKVDFEYVHAAAQIAANQRAVSFVWVSSVGADAKSNNFYLRVKGEVENAVKAIPNLRNATAIRPSLLVGDRVESRPAERFGILVGQCIAPLMLGPLRKYRPVHAEDVARQMISAQVF